MCKDAIKDFVRLYLKDDEYESLADAVFVVQGRFLPVHSQVVSQHSSVLRGLFLSQKEQQSASQEISTSLKEVVLEAPWHGYTVAEVAAFLQVLYNPAFIAAADFSEFSLELSGMLRLAHQLEVLALQDSITQHVERLFKTCSKKELLEWLSLLEELNLYDCWASGLLKLAEMLIAMKQPHGNRTAFQLKEHLSSTSMAALLGCVLRPPHGRGQLKAVEVAAWLSGASEVSKGKFTWHITQLNTREEDEEVGQQLQRHQEPQRRLFSDAFTAVGRSWRLLAFPRGSHEEGFLSLFLTLDKPIESEEEVCTVTFQLRLLHQTDQEKSIVRKATHCFSKEEGGMGFPKFEERAKVLNSGSGYLVGNALTVEVEVEEGDADDIR